MVLVMQLLFQKQVVLDYSIVYQSHRTCLVRMRIGFGRFAVGSPAGVADPDPALHRHGSQQPVKIHQFAFAPPDLGLTPVDGTDTGGIITAIFQLLQTGKNDRRSLLLSYIPNDSTHVSDLQPLLERHFPFTGRFDDEFKIVMAGCPFRQGFQLRTVGNQRNGIAWATFAFLYRKTPSGNYAGGVNNLSHRIAMTVATVEHFRHAGFQKIIQSADMRLG